MRQLDELKKQEDVQEDVDEVRW